MRIIAIWPIYGFLNHDEFKSRNPYFTDYLYIIKPGPNRPAVNPQYFPFPLIDDYFRSSLQTNFIASKRFLKNPVLRFTDASRFSSGVTLSFTFPQRPLATARFDWIPPFSNQGLRLSFLPVFSFRTEPGSP